MDAGAGKIFLPSILTYEKRTLQSMQLLQPVHTNRRHIGIAGESPSLWHHDAAKTYPVLDCAYWQENKPMKLTYEKPELILYGNLKQLTGAAVSDIVG